MGIERRSRRRLPAFLLAGTLAALAAFGAGSAPGLPAHALGGHACPASLTEWKAALGAAWLDCHQLTDLTTTGNPYTDPNSLTGMGSPPPGTGTLNSRYTHPASPAVSGLQLDGYFPDGCNAYQLEPAHLAKNGAPFLPGCTPSPGGTCSALCHNDGQFVLRIPDDWNGRLLTTGTPGIRDAFASDFIFSDYAVEHGWAYVSQDKGNMGANFFQGGCDERGSCSATWPGGCTSSATPWCAGVAITEWTFRIRQATRAARSLLSTGAASYGLSGVTRSYVAGVSNGGYQTRRALETDTPAEKLYDGGVDWEGTLFVPSPPPGVVLDRPTTGYNLFTYLPTALNQAPQAIAGDPTAIAALGDVGFNPESQPLWADHEVIYWGLTQKAYRLAADPEYTNYSCSGGATSCVMPPVLPVPPGDPDSSYNYSARTAALPALSQRIARWANTGRISAPLITLHGDQDALLPLKTDSDLYAQMVKLAGAGTLHRYYVVRGGNHVDPQFDNHYGSDGYGNSVLRPILPCAWASLDAVTRWTEQGTPAPPSHTIPRPASASAEQLANSCDLAAQTSGGAPGAGPPAAGGSPPAQGGSISVPVTGAEPPLGGATTLVATGVALMALLIWRSRRSSRAVTCLTR